MLKHPGSSPCSDGRLDGQLLAGSFALCDGMAGIISNTSKCRLNVKNGPALLAQGVNSIREHVHHSYIVTMLSSQRDSMYGSSGDSVCPEDSADE